MFRSIFVPIVVSVLALFNFYSSDVNVSMNLPSTANAGDEILVELTIVKGDVEGFARFQQDLPVGFTAVPRQTANGDFKFEDQTIKIQWMRVPLDREFVISYAIRVAATVSGNFNFDGKFSYIVNNGVQTASLASKSITIIGDETLAGTAESANTTYTYQNVSLKKVDCIRQKPYLNENNEVIVNLMINKGSLTDFGKIQEQIPRGYRAVSLRSKNSIFTFSNSIIKFLWMNMPSDEQFVVSYKLIPEGDIPDQAFLIAGTFSYAENERTIPINIAERDVDLDNFKGDMLIASTTVTEPEPDPVVVKPIEIKPTPQDTYIAESTPVETKTTVKNNSYSTSNTANNYNSNLANITDIPMPEDGVAYRVQIAAGHNLVSDNYFRKLNVTDQVQIEIHEGWHKYTVGNFPLYRDARDYRVYIWNNTPIHDAFVAAYNSGLRITVQEALMIANQKWYQ